MNKQQRDHIEEVISYLQQYIDTYSEQEHYTSYSERIVIDDMLYGLGVALYGEKAKFANGYRWFKREVLLPHILNSTEV